MLAGYAVERNGHEPVFYARPLRSHVLEGAYLMRRLPGMDATRKGDGYIEYIQRGDKEVYAEKVYGDRAAPVSWDAVRWGRAPLWWLDTVYRRLYDRYEGNISPIELSASVVAAIAKSESLTISTVPLNAICAKLDKHKFMAADISLVRIPSDHGRLQGGNMMIYNGLEGVPWFKFTRVGGWDTWEYGQRIPQILEYASEAFQISQGLKLVSNTCDCHPRVYRVGRWGQWQRGILNHHPFEQAQALLASAGLGKVA